MKQDFKAQGYRRGIKPTTFHLKRIPTWREFKAPLRPPHGKAHTKATKQNCWTEDTFSLNLMSVWFAQCQMIRLLIGWGSEECQEFRRGAAPPAKKLESACGKNVTQRCYYRWHKCPPLLPNLPHVHELFEFSMRISDSDRMQDASFDFKPTVQPRRTWSEWPLMAPTS